MKKKFLGRVLTMLLVASMVFTLLPAPAIAAGNWWWNNEEAESLADTTDSILPHRIIHLDCGRKYFSVDNVKSLIDVMAAYGYNELELAFGNAGLRFLLGDMSISFGTTSYTDSDIRTAVVEGNKKQNNSTDGRYWTETDMTEILGYASSKNIEIVPLLNMPGHMNALLNGEQFHQYRISGTGYDENKKKVQKTSCTSIDPGKADAAAFGHAILQKYVKWFKDYNDSNPDGKVKYFNFGADEVGNDIVNPFYANDLNPNRYDSCVKYINGCANIIEAAGMTPRAFNDLLYFYSRNVEIDQNIEVCYWNNQWGSSPYASANAISGRGHKMINTNSEWYYVLGVKNEQKEVDNNLSHALNSVETYNYNDFFVQGQANNKQTIADTAGVMLCIWCDNPNEETPETAIEEATQLFEAFAEKNSAVFPAKGEIPPTPQPEPTEPTTKEINITVGQTYTETINGNYPGDRVTNPTGIATVTGEVISGTPTQTLGDMYEVYYYNGYQSATGVISDGSNNNFLKVSGEYLTNTTNIEEATKFTVTKTSTNKATIQVTDTNSYLKLMNTSGSTSSIMAVEESYEWEVGLGSDFCWYAGLNNYYYLAYYGENWTSNNNWAYAGHLYAVEPGTTSTTDKTKLTFTGVKTGNTEVTIGNVTYKVHVSDALADNGDLYVDFWVTSSMITPKNTATTNQNGHIYATYTKEQFSSEGGVLLSEVIPQEGTYQTGTGTSATNHDATYWKTRYLPNECRQKAEGWTNKNGVGTDTMTEGKGGRDVERIRYWEGKWQYLAVNGGEWTTFTTSQDTSGNQMAAYYVIKTNVTKEVTTYVTDWSDEQTQEMYGVALDFCVKYPSQDTRVPATFKNTNTQWFNCKGEKTDAYNNGYSVYASDKNVKVGSWEGMRTSYPTQGNWYRVINHIEVTEDRNYEVYMITATPSTSFNNATSPLTCPENISYTGTERVLWAKNESVVTDSGLTKHSDYKMGGSPVIERVMIQQCSGMLLTYYVRPKAVANPLTVHFREMNAATDFAFYQIIPQAPNTTFDSDIALPNTSDQIGDLVNATIRNDVGVDQTVTSNLHDVPGVPAQYRKTAFKCVGLTKTDDLREITLYYTFDNSVAFVADFGLPLTITPKDVNSNLIAENITGAAVSGGSGLTVDTSNPTAIIVTPNKDFASKTSTSFTLTYTGTGDSVTYLVYILPASNVLYEENFLTQSNENGRKDWTESEFGTAQQQTQKLKEQQTFGFDKAYEDVTSARGYWTADNLMTKADSTKSLTTDFYGNAIDVIGSCGQKTGIVMVSIKNAATGKPVKSVVIETTYTAGTIDQVPLAHIELSGNNANYTAVIRGYAPLDAAQQQSGSLMLAADYYGGSYDALAADLAEMGLSLSDVEFIRASGAAAKTASTRRAAQAYALETVAESRNSDNTVTIDGFRVYRSANNEAYAGITNEYQVTYSNILKVMNGQVITAYVDGSGKTVETCNISEYEKLGGPQNEIYLQKNQVIAFKLLDSNNNVAADQEIQISLSAVSGETQYNSTKKISSTMEMYYTLTTNDKGIVTIMNTGDNLLAIGNVKVPAGCTTVAPRNLDTQELVRSINLALNAAPETPDVGFAPAISAKVTTTRFIRSKVVTLTVSASSDVAVLEVNGVELRPTNSWLVKMGWSDTYTYILTEKVQKNEIKTYEIVGYRADGAASAPIVVKSK